MWGEVQGGHGSGTSCAPGHKDRVYVFLLSFTSSGFYFSPLMPRQPLFMSTAQQPLIMPTAQQPLIMSTAQQPLFVSTAQQPLFVSTAQQPLFVSTAQQHLFISTAQQPLFVSTAQQPLFVSTAQQPLFVPTAQQPLFMPTAQQPLFMPTAQQPQCCYNAILAVIIPITTQQCNTCCNSHLVCKQAFPSSSLTCCFLQSLTGFLAVLKKH